MRALPQQPLQLFIASVTPPRLPLPLAAQEAPLPLSLVSSMPAIFLDYATGASATTSIRHRCAECCRTWKCAITRRRTRLLSASPARGRAVNKLRITVCNLRDYCTAFGRTACLRRPAVPDTQAPGIRRAAALGRMQRGEQFCPARTWMTCCRRWTRSACTARRAPLRSAHQHSARRTGGPAGACRCVACGAARRRRDRRCCYRSRR